MKNSEPKANASKVLRDSEVKVKLILDKISGMSLNLAIRVRHKARRKPAKLTPVDP